MSIFALKKEMEEKDFVGKFRTFHPQNTATHFSLEHIEQSLEESKLMNRNSSKSTSQEDRNHTTTFSDHESMNTDVNHKYRNRNIFILLIEISILMNSK